MSKSSRWANEVIVPTGDVLDAARDRRLMDMPDLLPETARWAATLTGLVRQQEFLFEPAMVALENLSRIEDWSLPVLVADGEGWQWKRAPWRKYQSFDDFYVKEIEPFWGKWERLRDTYARVKRGEISPEEGKRWVVVANGGDRRSEQARQDQSSIRSLKSYGTTRAYTLARLDRDRPDLAAQVRSGALSANAAAIAAGFRRQPTALERILKLLPALTPDERAELRRELDALETTPEGEDDEQAGMSIRAAPEIDRGDHRNGSF